MKKIIVLIPIITITGCATNIRPSATGGSKADGTVTMSYQYGGFQKPVIDWNQAAIDAANRCASWGYTGAEPFGGSTSQCVFNNGYGCNRWQVNMQYQCTGQK